MPVASTVIPSPLSFRDGNSRPATGVRRVTRAVREGQEPRAGTACRTRAGIARATWRGHRGVAGRCRAARPKGRSARRPGCRPARRAAPGWWRAAPAPTTRASALGSHPGAAAGNVVGRSRGKSAIILRERHHERGGLAGGDRTMWARGYHAGTVGPGESVTGRHVRRQPDGSRTGWRECPRRGRRQRSPARRGNAAVVTGPYGASLKSLATPGDLYSSVSRSFYAFLLRWCQRQASREGSS